MISLSTTGGMEKIALGELREGLGILSIGFIPSTQFDVSIIAGGRGVQHY